MYNESTGEFQAELNEHYFLTDPEDLLLTHFPFADYETAYNRWQLIDEPITLEDFNSKPHLSSYFFDLGLELVDDVPTPFQVEDTAIIKIKSWEVIRYKVDIAPYCIVLKLVSFQYKLFEASEEESETLNNYCTCHLEGENRTTAVFTLSVPTLGDYYLKYIYIQLIISKANLKFYP